MNICVYGASSTTIDKRYVTATEELGRRMVERGHSLVYGGGANGLMGAVARGVHEKNGHIVGVAPSFFCADGVLYNDCNEFIYTDTMRQRKQIMEDRADAFIVTPGGIGTFEEFFEIFTLKQLGRHKKPIAVYNIDGYYDPMDNMIKYSIAERFLNEECCSLYKVFDNIDELLDYVECNNDDYADITKMKDIK